MKDQPYMPQCDLSRAMTPQEIARQRAEVIPQPKTVTLNHYLLLGGEVKVFVEGMQPSWEITPRLIKTETIEVSE